MYLDGDCGKGFVRIENGCYNVSYAKATKEDILVKCAALGAQALSTSSSAIYFQLRDYLNEFETEDIWSDFVGSGSTATEYYNAIGNTTEALNMDYAWLSSASFGPPCVRMKKSGHYHLEPSACSGEAKFVCTKSLCPNGFEWFDKKGCAKLMRTPSPKDDALSQCQDVNPGASLIGPQSPHEQSNLIKFLKQLQFKEEIYLGAKKQESGHWMWDNGHPLFVQGILRGERSEP